MLRALVRTVVPARIRRSRAAARLRRFLSRHGIAHDWFYSREYFDRTVETPAAQSAVDIADSIVGDFKPRSVVDVGCGTGALLTALRDRGCDVLGFEYSKVALEYCRARKLAVEKFDLERNSLDHERRFDVAVSMEVAEHLPESVAERYVDLLTRLAPAVVFTAATPGQGGNDHVNEQPTSYWIAKFGQRSFQIDEDLTQRWRAGWEAGGRVRDWYYRNLMVFRADAR